MQPLALLRSSRALFVLLSALLLVSQRSNAQTAPQGPIASQLDDGISSQVIKLQNGITLNYAVQGDPKGPVIVMLHGAGDSWHSFARVLPLLPSRYRVYAVTLRGHGLSDHPDSGYSRDDFAGDILGFLDELHIQHATLVGHSLGSFVAQKVAERDNGHLDRLVLIGSGPGTRKVGSSEQNVTSPFGRLTDPIPYTFARDFQASTIYYPVPAWFFEMMVGEAQRVPAATWHGIGASISGANSLEDLKKIRIPTLLLWGEKDSIFHRDDQEILLRNVPQASLKAYPETGHALHWERPQRFTADLLTFIRSSGSPKTQP
jgi:pimeloyl-ACP methyl ester carboxylesterase